MYQNAIISSSVRAENSLIYGRISALVWKCFMQLQPRHREAASALSSLRRLNASVQTFSLLVLQIKSKRHKKSLKTPKAHRKVRNLHIDKSSKLYFFSFIIRINLYHIVPVSFVHLEYKNTAIFSPCKYYKQAVE